MYRCVKFKCLGRCVDCINENVIGGRVLHKCLSFMVLGRYVSLIKGQINRCKGSRMYRCSKFMGSDRCVCV